MVPKVEFEVSKVVNEFCHLCVLYSDLMPRELANGILGNRGYLEKHHRLRDDAIRLQLQKTALFSEESEWYEFVTGLMKRDKTGGFRSLSRPGSFVELFQGLRLRSVMGFDEVWRETRPRLVEYMYRFQSQWAPICDRVLSNLRELAKAHWQTGTVQVHYVDCLYGGFAWKESIGLHALPDVDVQKKFLAHELSELITPQHLIKQYLQKAGLDVGIAHTVVDLLAYFSVKDFVSERDSENREKKGIKPSRKHYPMADVLFLFFERYADNPMLYPEMGAVLRDMVSILQPESAGRILTG